MQEGKATKRGAAGIVKKTQPTPSVRTAAVRRCCSLTTRLKHKAAAAFLAAAAVGVQNPVIGQNSLPLSSVSS